MKPPWERFHDLLANVSDKDLAEIDSRLADPTDMVHTRKVEWRDDPDPFMMGWEWVQSPKQEAMIATVAGPAAAASKSSPDPLDPSRPSPRFAVRTGPRWGWKLVGLAAAASIVGAAGLLGYRHLVPSLSPLREESIAVWAADVNSRRIMAGNADPDQVPVAEKIDILGPGIESSRTLPPSVLAPVAVQEALEIAEVPEGADLKSGRGRPIPTIINQVAPGSMFYLMFKTPGSETAGTAIAIRMGSESWKLLWEETAASAEAPVNVFGPIKARNPAESYLVVAASKTSTPLLNTVSSCLPRRGSRPEDWRPQLADALRKAGHSWFGLQVVRIEAGAASNNSTQPSGRTPQETPP